MDANAALRTNDLGRQIIRQFEWVGLEADLEPGGAWVVGFGHTSTAAQGQTIGADEAETLFEADLAIAEDMVRNAVTVPLNENEFSALVSLAFNIGQDSFCGSTVLKRLNQGARNAAAQAFFWWSRTDDGDPDTPLPALTSRRAAEIALFLAPVELNGQGRIVPPYEHPSPRSRGTLRSRTIFSAVVAGVASVIAFIQEFARLVDLLNPNNPAIRSAIEFLLNTPPHVYLIFAFVAIIAIGYIMFDYWRDMHDESLG